MRQVRSTESAGGILPEPAAMAIVAVGSNKAFKSSSIAETVRNAIGELGATAGSVRAVSRFFRTAAYPAGSGPDFVNAALLIDTELSASALLAFLHEVETRFGRTRTIRWGPRTLDLDLIGYDDLVLPDMETYRNWSDLPLDRQLILEPEHLILPHPRLHERAFVLLPMLDVAPDWCHPVTGLTTAQMVKALPADLCAEVMPL